MHYVRITLVLVCVALISAMPLTARADDAAATKSQTDNANSNGKAKASTDVEKAAEKAVDKSAEAIKGLIRAAGGSDTDGAKKKKIRFGHILLKEEYPEGISPQGLFGELQPRLRDVVGWLDKAAKDDSLKGVILQIENPTIGMGKIAELRSAIARVRKSGKKVYAQIAMGMNRDYLVASACDEIVMPEAGILMITGLRAEVMFFKNMFDKLGIQADFVQIGDFKGAADPFTRSDMSPEFRKQFELVIDDYYKQMVEMIAADRKLKPERVRELIDEGLFTAAKAKSAGLVDRLSYDDELASQLKQQYDAQTVVVLGGYGKTRMDTDLSGFAGFMKLIEMVVGSDQAGKGTRTQKIAVVYAVGPIMPGESKSGVFAEVLGAETIVKALRTAEKDERVKATVLRVDSPGGSAIASDLIWREMVRAKKPIVASMGDVAGSGGYYISMGADKIFAEAGTLTGSIGVVSGKLALKGFLNKLGITTHVISRGKNSGVMSPFSPMVPSEREAWMKISRDIYGQFTRKVAEGRKLDPAKVEQLAQGRLFTGRIAASNGLVDKVGTLDDAIAEAKVLAGLKADEKVELLVLPKPKSFLEQLLESPAGEDQTWSAVPEARQSLQMLSVVRELFRQPAVTWMPYQVEIK